MGLLAFSRGIGSEFRIAVRPAVCRKCYVHPVVLERYLAGKLERRIRRKAEETKDEVLRKEEHAVMELLQEKLRVKGRR
jgi:DNA topoisomerase I